MRPEGPAIGPEDQGDDVARRRAGRISREKRISLLAQLVVLVIGIGLLIYGLVSYSTIARTLTRRAPQAFLLPVAFSAGLVYFTLRALAVYRHLRRLR